MSKENDINTEKIAYLLNLMGKSRPEKESTSDSDFEDIESEDEKFTANIQDYKMLSARLSVPPIEEDNYISVTTDAQEDVAELIGSIYKEIVTEKDNEVTPFTDELHTKYIQRCLFEPLPGYYKSLDANHSWMLYWLLNFNQLLPSNRGKKIPSNIVKLVSEKINSLIVNDGLGGIAGGRNQVGHAASTYASVLALTLIEDYETLDRIRFNLYKWIMNTLKTSNGSFVMHADGESDTRSTYCVLIIASLLNILTDELLEGTASWISSCQTFEGGFAGVPHTEAHGGYTFCAVASFFLILGRDNDAEGGGSILQRLGQHINLESLLRWSVMRQYQLEGGLSGRTNKLVDACYSFWIGGVFPLLEMVYGSKSLFDRDALKCYILNCCQDSRGGLRDKPGKSPDFYHSNYTTLGLCICENHFTLIEEGVGEQTADRLAYKIEVSRVDEQSETIGINPIFGLPAGYAEKCKEHFVTLDRQ